MEGIRQLTDSVFADVPVQTASIFKNALSETFFKQFISPGQSLGEETKTRMVADRWRSVSDFDTSAGTMKIQHNFVFRNWEQHLGRHCALVEYTLGFDMKGSLPDKSSNQPFKITNGSGSGKTWFDPILGMPVESVNDQDMEFSAPANVQTKIKQHIAATLIDVRGEK